MQKQAETKHRSFTAAHEQLVATLPEELNLTDIAEGTTVGQRVGRSIQISSVFFQCGFSNSLDFSTPTDKAYYGRVILYTPRDPTNPNPLESLPFELTDNERYIIWADKTVPIPWGNGISNSMITIKKRFKPYMKAIYDSSTSSSIEKGPLYLVITVNNTVAITEVSYACRLYYKDL